MSRKIIAVLLALAMIFALGLTACGGEEPEETDAAEAETTAADTTAATTEEVVEPTEIHWYSSVTCAEQDAWSDVGPWLTDYFLENANAEVNFHWTSSDYTSKLSAAIIAGVDCDMFYLKESKTGYYIWYQRNALQQLDDLLNEYAPEYYAACPDYMWDGCKIDGGIYIMKTNKDLCVDIGFQYNKTMTDELGLTDKIVNSGFENADDLDELFYEIKAGRDAAHASQENTPLIDDYNTLHAYIKGDVISGPVYAAIPGLNSLEDYGDGSTVFDVYETTDYRDAINMITRWVNDGIMPYDASNFDNEGVIMESGAMLGAFEWGYVCVDPNKYENYELALQHPQYSFASCTAMQSGQSLLNGLDEDVQAACMKVFNLVCQDPVVSTSVRFGVEGDYWTLGTDDLGNQRAIFDGTKNEDPNNRAYYFWYLAEMGNLFTVYLPQGQDDNFFEALTAMNENGVGSTNMGFMFVTSDTENELAAVANVIDEYNGDLILGMISDCDARLDEFAAAMQANGITAILESAQSQLDAWRG